MKKLKYLSFLVRSVVIGVACLVIVSCTSPGRMGARHTTNPHDATPKQEAYTKGANGSYTVRGKHYQVRKTHDGYKERGVASWYGKPFHGRLTSNGERYDMYKMSAAHKSLPIPCYVKVTNLENKKTVVVRVNDHGPFHSNRIIDLSYAAAKKLGMDHKGTARVEVEAISVNKKASTVLAENSRKKKSGNKKTA